MYNKFRNLRLRAWQIFLYLPICYFTIYKYIHWLSHSMSHYFGILLTSIILDCYCFQWSTLMTGLKSFIWHANRLLFAQRKIEVLDSPPRHESPCSGPTFPASVSSIPAGTPLKTRRPGHCRSGPECQSLWSCAPCEDRFRATRAAPPWSAASDTRHLRGSPAWAWKNKYLLWDYGSLFSLSRFLIALRSSRGKRAPLGESLVKRKIVAKRARLWTFPSRGCFYGFIHFYLHVNSRGLPYFVSRSSSFIVLYQSL